MYNSCLEYSSWCNWIFEADFCSSLPLALIRTEMQIPRRFVNSHSRTFFFCSCFKVNRFQVALEMKKMRKDREEGGRGEWQGGKDVRRKGGREREKMRENKRRWERSGDSGSVCKPTAKSCLRAKSHRVEGFGWINIQALWTKSNMLAYGIKGYMYKISDAFEGCKFEQSFYEVCV